jgi:hypothetical protein
LVKELKVAVDYIYLRSILLCLTIARDLLGGIIAIGYFRTVMILLMSITILVWYLTLSAAK